MQQGIPGLLASIRHGGAVVSRKEPAWIRSYVPAIRAARGAGSARQDTRRQDGSGEHLSSDSRMRYLRATVTQYLSSAQVGAFATVSTMIFICNPSMLDLASQEMI